MSWTSNSTSKCHSSCEPLNAGDVAFIIMASTFVMLQTPALGLAQAGMIRRKNALSMLMQTLTGLGIGSLLWFSVGFTLTFGPSHRGIIGNFDYAFLVNVGIDCCFPLSTAKTLPGILFATFQMMFALMVPVIVTGAWAERMEFKAFLWFALLWPFLVYYPLAHWIWNQNGWLAELGVLDFAGGLTIHSSTGVAALVVSSILSGRMKNTHNLLGHHNLPMFVLGGALIWGGWYSFNAGSAYTAGPQAAAAMLNTHLSASSGAAIWIILHYYSEKKWTLTEIMNGAFAGLAAITPGSGFVVPWTSVLIGCCGSMCSFLWVTRVKPRIGVDDALDVAALQGVPGILGTFMVGLFAESKQDWNSIDSNDPNKLGLFRGGNGKLLAVQSVGVVVTVVWTFVMTYMLMIWMRRYVGIDVSPECEEKGLDLIQIGEQAYDEILSPMLDLGADILTAKLIDAACSGNLNRVKELVEVGARPEVGDYDGRTPLHLAAAGGHLETMKYLYLQHGVDIHAEDRYGNTPMHDAMENNNTETVRFLKRLGAKANLNNGYMKDRDILQAAAEGNIVEVKWRLKQNNNLANAADYDRRTALHVAASEGHDLVVRELLRRGADPHALDRWGLTAHTSAIKGKHASTAEELANWMLNEPESPRSPGSHCSDISRRGSYEHRRLSLQRRGNHSPRRSRPPDVPSSPLNILVVDTDVNAGQEAELKIPLLSASAMSDPEPATFGRKMEEADGSRKFPLTPEMLNLAALESLPSVEMMSVDARALITASDCGDLNEIIKLVSKGACIDQADYDGRTSAHLASSNGHIDVVRYLIQNNASLDVFDRFGRTPLQDALDMGHTQIARILRNGGATVTNPALARQLCQAAATADMDTLATVELTGGNLGCSDYDGRTAMHLGASEGKIKVVQWLISRGVRANPRDRWGGTPLDDANREGFPDIVQLLSGSEVNNLPSSPASKNEGGGNKAHQRWQTIKKAVTFQKIMRTESLSSMDKNGGATRPKSN